MGWSKLLQFYVESSIPKAMISLKSDEELPET